jgi:hypothetical protein
MKIPVILEPIAGNGYRAREGAILGATAEGTTQEEALQNLRNTILGQLTQGAELVSLEIQAVDRPWASYAGTWDENDPFIDEWRQQIEDYRREMDEDPEVR